MTTCVTRGVTDGGSGGGEQSDPLHTAAGKTVDCTSVRGTKTKDNMCVRPHPTLSHALHATLTTNNRCLRFDPHATLKKRKAFPVGGPRN